MQTSRNIVFTLLCIVALAPATFGQLAGDQLYIFPSVLWKADKEKWDINPRTVFNSSIGENRIRLTHKTNPEIMLCIQPHTLPWYDASTYQRRCTPGMLENYPHYIKPTYSRLQIHGEDTLMISLHTTSRKSTFHVGACKRSPLSCLIKVSLAGPAKDSAAYINEVIQILKDLRPATTQEMDALFQLPLAAEDNQGFPADFTFTRYEQTIQRKMASDFTLDEVLRYHLQEPFPCGHALYRGPASSWGYSDRKLIEFIQPFAPDFKIDRISGQPSAWENRVRITIAHKYQEAHLIFTRKGQSFTAVFFPPIPEPGSKARIGDMYDFSPFYVREQSEENEERPYQYTRVYLLNNSPNTKTSWINFDLPVQTDSTYLITVQYDGTGHEDHQVLNGPRWRKTHYGEHPEHKFMAVNMAPVMDGDPRGFVDPFAEINKVYNKLRETATTKDRLYLYRYGIADLNKDGQPELFSFSISAGKVVHWKCYTYNAKGLKPLTDAKTLNQIKQQPIFKRLYERSLLAVDTVGWQK